MSPGLSKSRLMSFRQCPKRLWLEKHRPELAAEVPGQEAAFATGHEVGDLARQLYDRVGEGILIGYDDGLKAALQQTTEVLAQRSAAPVFEATFQRNGLLVRADVLDRGPAGPRLVEVKASTSVKPEHVEDCAIQSWVLETSAARPRSVSLAHVNNQFTYAGEGAYEGWLVEQELTADVAPVRAQVPGWVRMARQVLTGDEPKAAIGTRCRQPYECPFQDHCWPSTGYPLTGLPGIGRQLDAILAEGLHDVRDLEDRHLTTVDQRRVAGAARSGRASLSPAARAELAAHPAPRFYLDFETISFAIPRWPGTRPYQQLPFQFSLHVEEHGGRLQHAEFLDLSGDNPARAVARALVDATRGQGPVFMYTSFERRCVGTLADFCPDLRPALESLASRLVDLHPIVKRHYYHPAMHGSWSIKAVLPTVAPDLDYAALGEIREGGAAQQAYLEAVDPETTPEGRLALREGLLAYCRHDTLAMARLAAFLEGRD